MTFKLSHTADFSEAAEDYKNARPPYHLETIKKIFQKTHINLGDTVAELGCGEGGLTRVILQHPDLKLPLYCIERDPGMIVKFKEHMAEEISAGKVVLIEGSAEKTNLPEGVKPKVFIGGDMAHWLSPECTSELKTKLKPGGKLAFITRYPDARDPLVWKLHELLLQHSAEYREEGANTLANLPGPGLDIKQAKHLVANATATEEPLADMRSKEGLFAYLRSRSTTREYCKPKRLPSESDDQYTAKTEASKAKAMREVIDPVFELAKELKLIHHSNGEEKISLNRTLFVTIGRPKPHEPVKGPLGHATGEDETKIAR